MDSERWDKRYRDAAAPAEPARVLLDNCHLLPQQGRALDLACGLGANALFLARRGLDVTAWDHSGVAIGKLCTTAAAEDISITAEMRDVVAQPPKPQDFDVIVVSRFLERTLVPHLVDALRPDGVIFYQTFVREAVDETIGPKNPLFRLERNELLELFESLYLLVYREEGRVGDVARGFRNEAMLVAGKPSSI
ncbi:MAG TPA: methyltransferase domain-containing protein [Gammaproteobacteria bacterium]|nr:methyltransferase domain-containing protein [Gammaproteobacteria bacterium]